MAAVLTCSFASISPIRNPSHKKSSQIPSSSSSINNRKFPIRAQMSRIRELISDIPHILAQQKDILKAAVSTVDDRLGSHLLPSSLSVPPDVESYQSPTGSSQGVLNINRGDDASPVDFLLTNCMHLTLPNGATMNVVTLHGHLKATTDAPHLVFEVIHLPPSNLILCLDLTPRKDLILHPDYLKAFYEEGGLEQCRRAFYERVPEAEAYVSPSMHVRSVLSPTGILATVNCGDRAVEIVREGVGPVAEEVVRIWAENCGRERAVSEEERRELERRDLMLKKKTVEIDLAPKFPAIFGEDVGSRVVGVITKVYGT